MKKLLSIVALLSYINAFGNQPVCTADEYAVRECNTVYLNGKPVQECRWVCRKLSSAGR